MQFCLRDVTAVRKNVFRFSSCLTLLVVFLLSLLVVPSLQAEILQENESLRGFLAGHAPNASYDNWLSHVSEGINTPGYNDYGPEWFDPQAADGFGSFRFIPDSPAGDRLLDHWRRIFDSFLLNHPDNVEQLLQDSLDTFHYELVQFTDTDRDRNLLILREMLNPAYVDTNGPGPLDDVTGGFDNAWGIYVLDLDASRPWLMVQEVHPCDDFIGIQGALELFFRLDAGLLCIHGAGREVLVTEGGTSLNSRSKSDPSRYGRAPLQIMQDAFVDLYADDYPHNAMVVQVHSYDRSNGLLHPVIISEGAVWSSPLLPFRDLSGEKKSIIQMTAEPPIPAHTYGSMDALPIDAYYAINVSSGYTFEMPSGTEYFIYRPPSHRGDPSNVQMLHLHEDEYYEDNQAIAPFFHIELDEWPNYFEQAGANPEDFINDPDGVPTWEDYQFYLDFYAPFFDAMEAWFDWFDDPISTVEPIGVQIGTYPTYLDGSVTLGLQQLESDYRRSWIEIFIDTDEITDETEPFLDGHSLQSLKATNEPPSIEITSLPEDVPLHFAVRSRMLNGDRGVLSDEVVITLNDSQGEIFTHSDITDFPHAAWPPWISAQFTDDSDVDRVEAFWYVNDGQPESYVLEKANDFFRDTYASPIPLDQLQVQVGDQVYYQIVSYDRSSTGNPVTYPAVGEWNSFTVTNAPDPFRLRDFENEDADLVLNGDWARGTPSTEFPGTVFSGDNLIATNLDGGCSAGSINMAVLEDALLTEYGPLIISYWQMNDYLEDPEHSGVALEGGTVYYHGPIVTGPAFGGNFSHHFTTSSMFYNGFPCFSGTSTEWEHVVIDLGRFYGMTQDLRFQSLVEEDPDGSLGWYIDDVQLVRSINAFTPTPPLLLAPEAETVFNLDDVVTFRWSPSQDPDPRTESPVYNFNLQRGDDLHTVTSLTDTLYTLDMATLEWTLEMMEGEWWVEAISQADTVADVEGGRRIIFYNNATGEEQDGLPRHFSLGATYPNPFNSSMTINYELPRHSQVRLEIFNLLGQRVALLENRELAAGYRHAVWDANSFASGMYLVRMEAGSYSAVRKVMLLK